MAEQDIIAHTPAPATRASLARQLSDGGLRPGGVTLAHTSLSALGYVAGGPVAVIQALLDCIGPDGTLVMPAHSAQLTDPAEWSAPPVPADWISVLRDETPAYDPATTPTCRMGAVAELFRTWPGARRSIHPTCSFAALGKLADWIVTDHALESPLGEQSPLAKLYEADADILLLGVDFGVCTMLHLAEQRAWPGGPKERQGSPIMCNGVRAWETYDAPALMDPEAFMPVGRSLIENGVARTFPVGAGRGVRVSACAAVDHAVGVWNATGR